MRFSLFNSACDFAQILWKELLQEGDSVIDATLGNGHDTLFLAKIVLERKGTLYGFDIQKEAIHNTWKRLKSTFSEEELKRVFLYHENHDTMKYRVMEPIKLIVYNLGYLPGGNKEITTKTSSTLESLSQGIEMLKEGGAISVVSYPGHPEGEKEEKALLEFFCKKDQSTLSISHMRLINRVRAPSVFFIQKSKKLTQNGCQRELDSNR